MQIFTDLEYLKIDIANNAGKSKYHLDSDNKPISIDKLNYDQRLDWFNKEFSHAQWLGHEDCTAKDIADFVDECLIEPEKALVVAGLMAYKDYLLGKPSGYRVAFDAISSGIQLMSALTACEVGLTNTGALGNQRTDVYTEVYKEYLKLVGSKHIKTRDEIKKAIMTKGYGSKRKPLELVGKEGLPYFFEAMQRKCTGAFMLGEILVNTWNPNKTYHSWVNADGHTSYIPVMVETEHTVAVLGLDIPIKIKEQGKLESGLSNAAHLVHATDAMLAREMVRRCKYEPIKISTIIRWLVQAESVNQPDTSVDFENLKEMGMLGRMIHLYNQTNFLTVRICDYIYSVADVLQMSKQHRIELLRVLRKMIQYKPFSVLIVHDSFSSLPCNANYVRYWYNDMLANLIESNILQFTVNQLVENPYQFHYNASLRKHLAERVRRESNYAIT